MTFERGAGLFGLTISGVAAYIGYHSSPSITEISTSPLAKFFYVMAICAFVALATYSLTLIVTRSNER